MPTPEELARINIDKQLTACGWKVQSRGDEFIQRPRCGNTQVFQLSG